MSAFEIFVDDDRYSVPTLYLISAEDELEARRTALSVLQASDHHTGVELCRDGDRIMRLGTFARDSGLGQHRAFGPRAAE